MSLKAKLNNMGSVWKTLESLYFLFLILYIVIDLALGATSIATFYAFTAFSVVTVVNLVVCLVQKNWFTILINGVIAFFVIMNYVAKVGLY